MSAEEYLKPYDEAYEAMHEAAIEAAATQALSPSTLYGVLGDLRGTASSMAEILPSVARAARVGVDGLVLYDAEGNNPHEQFEVTLKSLEEAAGRARELLEFLDQAQSSIASVSHRNQ